VLPARAIRNIALKARIAYRDRRDPCAGRLGVFQVDLAGRARLARWAARNSAEL
jgi:hypothetical protein